MNIDMRARDDECISLSALDGQSKGKSEGCTMYENKGRGGTGSARLLDRVVEVDAIASIYRLRKEAARVRRKCAELTLAEPSGAVLPLVLPEGHEFSPIPFADLDLVRWLYCMYTSGTPAIVSCKPGSHAECAASALHHILGEHGDTHLFVVPAARRLMWEVELRKVCANVFALMFGADLRTRF